MVFESQDEVLELFRTTGVLLEGHFLLTSGKHSPMFLQCSQVMQHPQYAEKLGRALATMFHERGISAVVGPAMGGIILAYEVARHLGVRGLFAEKDGERMVFRRGFQLSNGEPVLVVEDAVTTGGSVHRVIEAVQAEGAQVVGVAMLVDRSAGAVNFGVDQRALVELNIPSYTPDECPLCASGTPLTVPKAT